MPNIYIIRRTDRVGYDTYDSAVVVADNKDEAKCISPRIAFKDNYPAPTSHTWDGFMWQKVDDDFAANFGWTTPNNVEAILVGVADEKYPVGTVLCASFNAA